MELQRVTITPENGAQITALFNPTQYTLNKGNTIQKQPIPGLDSPIVQYVCGKERTLNMKLFFDTYEEQSDVTPYTNAVYNLLNIVPSTHAAPICDIRWGGFAFKGVLENVSGEFSLFMANGTPVRANLTVTFTEWKDVQSLVQLSPKQSADHQKNRWVKSGDRLDGIAGEEYEDPSQWRMIAEANNLEDPRQLEPGQHLVIPAIR
ncbi:MAG TPA: LysM peptidoglycan-binding domain-containing protein [Candidatus Eisenbacteria bacterium]|nr:LysM peptidoglycan-binding domain-containing protein [Candidatus Eisenbacteria bacterium]